MGTAVVQVSAVDLDSGQHGRVSSVPPSTPYTPTMVPPLLIHTSAPPLSSPLPPPQVRYSILRDQSGDWRFFTIDPSSGAVVTRATLDREQKATYLIEVQSQDGTESARQGQQGQPNTGTHSAYTNTHTQARTTQALFPCGHFKWFS